MSKEEIVRIIRCLQDIIIEKSIKSEIRDLAQKKLEEYLGKL